MATREALLSAETTRETGFGRRTEIGEETIFEAPDCAGAAWLWVDVNQGEGAADYKPLVILDRDQRQKLAQLLLASDK